MTDQDMTEQEVLFEAMPVPAFRLSREGKITAVNRAARKVFAIERDRVLGRPILGMVVPEDRDRIHDLFLRVLQGRTSEWTTRFSRGDAATRIQRVRAVSAGPEGGIVMFTTDLSDAREAAPEAAQLRTLLENLPGQFTAVLDRHGKIRSSSGMARTHFRDDVELVGEPYTVLLDPDQEETDQYETMLSAALNRDHWVGTHWHERVDGVAFPVRTFASPWVHPQDGRVIGALIVGRDASVEHSWRGRAHRAERFAAIGEFAASIAAEFGEGLSRLEREIGSADGARPELERLQAFARSVHELSEDDSTDRGAIQLRDVLSEVLSDFAPRLSAGPVSVTIDTQGPLPTVTVDRSQIHRLFEVLIENALDNVEGLRADQWIRVEMSVEADGLVTRVTDSGPALDDEMLHRVFEPFFTTKKGRPGLGLSVARALVRAHDGRIWTDTDDSGRVVFAVSLPTELRESRARFRPVPLILSQDRTILVVDDEEEVRMSMRRFLEKVGFDVREAWSGRSALAQITGGRRPELVLTDLRMRDGSGFWFLEELERDFPDLLRRTVILTGDSAHGEVERLLMRTGCPLVTKPVELAELLELLDEISRRD